MSVNESCAMKKIKNKIDFVNTVYNLRKRLGGNYLYSKNVYENR